MPIFEKSYNNFSFLGLFCRIYKEIKIADFASQVNVLGCESYRGAKSNTSIFVILPAANFFVSELCDGDFSVGKGVVEWKERREKNENLPMDRGKCETVVRKWKCRKTRAMKYC